MFYWLMQLIDFRVFTYVLILDKTRGISGILGHTIRVLFIYEKFYYLLYIYKNCEIVIIQAIKKI